MSIRIQLELQGVAAETEAQRRGVEYALAGLAELVVDSLVGNQVGVEVDEEDGADIDVGEPELASA